MTIESKARQASKYGKITKEGDDFKFFPYQRYYKKFGFKSHIHGFKAESLKGIIEVVATLLR